jgi:hypothetical protein
MSRQKPHNSASTVFLYLYGGACQDRDFCLSYLRHPVIAESTASWQHQHSDTAQLVPPSLCPTFNTHVIYNVLYKYSNHSVIFFEVNFGDRKGELFVKDVVLGV